MKTILIAAILCPLLSFAQTKEKTTWEKVKETSKEVGEKALDLGEKAIDKTKEVAKDTGEVMASAKYYRQDRRWIITGNYSYFDMLVPGKWGGSVGYVKNPANTYELDYMRGSLSFGWLGLDIGKIQEQRFSLIWRRYGEHNTFNYQMGINYNTFDIHLGSKLLSKITNTNADYSIMRIETLGLSWGIGNRWQTRGGFVWAFDWFQVHLPVATLNQDAGYVNQTPDENDKHNALSALNFIKHCPRLVALKLQLGVTF